MVQSNVYISLSFTIFSTNINEYLFGMLMQAVTLKFT